MTLHEMFLLAIGFGIGVNVALLASMLFGLRDDKRNAARTKA